MMICNYRSFLVVMLLKIVFGEIGPSAPYIDESLPEPSHTLETHQRWGMYPRRSHYKRSLLQDMPFGNDGGATDDKKNSSLPMELAPLYPGYGTHYAYIYVGTPPKRQSVIIDTGSHYTAFPCAGCRDCGTHTDPYFDPEKSSTSNIPECGGQRCLLSQSYSEGSSWKAYKVTDKLWIGGLTPYLVPGANKWSIDYPFACQTSEAGLFKSQLADGIMGVSNSEDTLMPMLERKGLTDNRLFALCFRTGGGVITLGGVDQRLHTPSLLGIQYAKLARTSNWYTLNLMDLRLEDQITGVESSIVKPPTGAAIFNMGKGVIIDSGTTATYLPAFLLRQFQTLFKSITGFDYTGEKPIKLRPEQIRRIPNLIWIFESTTPGKTVQIRMPSTSFIDSDGGGSYTFKVLLTEGSGTVLGANFMSGYNMIFDTKQRRIGFAEASCKLDSVIKPTFPGFSFPTLRPTDASKLPAAGQEPEMGPTGKCSGGPIDQCDAQCDQESGIYERKGHQDYLNCKADCTIQCESNMIARGSNGCIDTPWSECSEKCFQSRTVGVLSATGQCTHKPETRSCYTAACETKSGDYLVFIDLKIKRLTPDDWSYAYGETVITALSKMFDVSESSIEILSEVGGLMSQSVKLHMEMRLSLSDFKDADNNGISDLYDAAQSIPDIVDSDYFPQMFLTQLSASSNLNDKINYNRYGWLKPQDIEVINTMALPLGAERDPFEIPDAGVSIQVLQPGTTREMFFIGVALTAVLLVAIMGCLYCRLQRENAALAKDKLSGFSLRELIDRFNNERLPSRGRGGNTRYNRVRQTELELSSAPMLDNTLDSADLEDINS